MRVSWVSSIFNTPTKWTVSILTLFVVPLPNCRHWTSSCNKNKQRERHVRHKKQNLTVHSQAEKIQGKKIKCSLSLQDGLGVLWTCTGRDKKMREQSLISWKRRCGWCCTTGDKAFVLGARPVKRPAAEARWLEWWCDAGAVGEGFGGVVGQNQSNQWLKGEQAKQKKLRMKIKSK